MYKDLVQFVKEQFNTDAFIPLHEPRFIGNEKKYLEECIDSTFVSSVGKFVNLFEEMMAEIAGTKYAVATTNGTSALHICLEALHIDNSCEVITQALTFVATCNAISYSNAAPVFIDVDRETLGLSPLALEEFLNEHAEIRNDGSVINKKSGKRIAAVMPMHTFGHPVKIDEISAICEKYQIPMIEDSTESLGSFYKGRPTGSNGILGTFSFNGNKTVTCGGGGCVTTNDEQLAKHIKHITTTAKKPHKWEYVHDHIGYNYRLPNLNAALACAQLEKLSEFVKNKRELASRYKEFFDSKGVQFFHEPEDAKSNYWLNAVLLKDRNERNEFLKYTNENSVMTRPVWTLMNKLEMFKNCYAADLSNSEWIEDRLVNIPSSVRL
ncbi:MAG: LegC family aminotransferase [Chitinophagales bacterium]|nr:LegC family aminotransferase [Chitinophagales bacterium]